MVDLVYDAIDLSKLLQNVADDDCGACVLFTGSTRRWTGEACTTKLEYDAYEPMARQALEQLESSAKQMWNIKHVGIIHRLGEVGIGQVSVAVAVSSPHREASFQAAKWLIDTLKADVPIWKKDFGPEGDAAWVHPDVETKSP